MPQLLDPNFARSVVLLCEHGRRRRFRAGHQPPSGHVGRGGRAARRRRPHETAARNCGAADPWSRSAGGFSLASVRELPTPWSSAEGSFLRPRWTCCGASSRTGWPRTRILTGYAGWGPGQLDDELAASAWLTADIDPALVFDTPADRMWEAAIRDLGADPGLLQMGHGVH